MLKRRHIELDGFGTFILPPYLIRMDYERTRGWQARPPGAPSRFFADGPSKDAIASFEAACEYLKLAKSPEVPQHLLKQEHRDKAHPTGSPGVLVQFKHRKGRRNAEVHVVISNPCARGKPRTLYVGTENNWQSRIDAKLDEARKIRERFNEAWMKEKMPAPR